MTIRSECFLFRWKKLFESSEKLFLETSDGSATICPSCANSNLFIISQIPAAVYPHAIGARMKDGSESIFQKSLIIIIKFISPKYSI